MERKYLFNEVAQEYDKYRPGCPEQLFLEILEDAAIKPDDSILEIGCEIIEERSALTVKDGLVKDLTVKQYRRTDPYTAEEYTALLNTYSRHRLLPDEASIPLFEEVKNVIHQHGGIVHKPQAVVLFPARKNS
jgi:hypothetical protein